MNIKTKNLCKNFNGKGILRKINLEIEENKVTCIIGPNGAGKTTLLRILNLLEKPTSGEIYFDDKCYPTDSLQIRRKMTMVMQNPVMFNTSVYENVVYGLKIRKEREQMEEVKEALSLVGLWAQHKQPATTLSGGETQRVALARALILKPNVLFLDEPTVNLDPPSIKIIENLISTLKEKHEITIVLATHQLEEAERFAEKIYFLKEGEIIQEGGSKEIFSRPGSLFAAQFLGIENIFRGKIVKEKDTTFLDLRKIKIEVVTELENEVWACLKPEEILLSNEPLHSSARNSFLGKIVKIEEKGALVSVTVDCGIPFIVALTKRSLNDLNLTLEKMAYLTFKATAVHVFP